MEIAYWHKQTGDEPLFPDLLWSRPEHLAAAGKLLVIGGNSFSFAAAAEAYAESRRAGVGVAQVLLPSALKHTVGRVFEAGDFVPSTPSGSFSQKALSDFLAHSAWADGVLLAGDLGRNSETAILLEKFAEKFSGQLTLTKDAVDYFTSTPEHLLARPNTTLVLSFAQAQKLAMHAKFAHALRFDLGIIPLVELLHQFTVQFGVNLVMKHLENIFVASGGQVSSTRLAQDIEIWRVRTATHAAVWWLQNPSKPFEALTTAVQVWERS